jgi:hypothetical protein
VTVYACHPIYSRKLKIGRSWSRLAWAKKKDPISNIARAKGLGYDSSGKALA